MNWISSLSDLALYSFLITWVVTLGRLDPGVDNSLKRLADRWMATFGDGVPSQYVFAALFSLAFIALPAVCMVYVGDAFRFIMYS